MSADLEKVYIQTRKAIQKEIESFWGKYARDTGLSLEGARKALSKSEMKSYKEQTQEYYDAIKETGYAFDPAYRQKLHRQLSLKSAVSRLEALQDDCQFQIEKLYAQEQDSFEEGMGEVYIDTYYRATFDIQQGVGFGASFSSLNTKMIEKAVSQKWLGENYSDRIWADKDRLTLALGQIIPRGIALGQNPRIIGKDIANQMDVRRSYGERLARTEFNMIANEATADTYAEAGVERYQFLSTLDHRTSDVCFPGTAKVQSIESVKNVFRREYTGKMITITTSNGKQITGTPEHPILTSCGWLPLDKIEPNKHIIYSVIGNIPFVGSKQNISVPTNISEIFDSFGKVSGLDIIRRNGPTAQFDCDGYFRDNKICVFKRIKLILRNCTPSKTGKHIKQSFLRLCHNCIDLFRLRALFHLSKCGNVILVTPEIEVIGLGNAVEPTVGASKRANDFGRTRTRVEKFNRLISIFLGTSPVFSALKYGREPILLKETRHGSDCATILLGKFRGGYAIPILPENIVGKRIERTFNGHVYNLHTNNNIYINDSIIVHNCQGLDLKIFKLSEKMIGVNWPPTHPNCRSTTIAYFPPDEIDAVSDDVATRMARDPITGKNYYVPADMSYKEWRESLTEEQGKTFLSNQKREKYYESDKEQLASYRQFITAARKEHGDELVFKLFDGMPKTIDDFQAMKYLDSNKWDIIKDNRKQLTGDWWKEELEKKKRG